MNLKTKFNSVKKSVSSYVKGVVKNPKKKWTIISIFVLAVLIILVYANLRLFIAGIVNGQPITRLSLIQELEKQGGKQVLDSLVTQKLIDQEAKKKGITVSQADIDKEMTNIEDQLKAQGTDLDTALAFQGQTRDDLVKSLKVKILIEKLLSDKISVSEEDIKTYFDQNKATFPENSTIEGVRSQIVSTLSQQKLTEAYQTWLTEVKAKSKINILLNF